LSCFVQEISYDCMPNIYFYQHHAHHGVLRAVLSWAQANQVVSTRTCFYMGDRFRDSPDQPDRSRDFAVLSIEEGESNQEWQAGFYRLDASLTELNEVLRQLSL
jgi:hypothetical protein